MMITPDTRLGELLEAYPQLEQILIEFSPSFGKLKNPVLRRTVAKVATLAQAARIADVEVGRLVQVLREAAGQAEGELPASEAPSDDAAPAWVESAEVARTIDVDAMLEEGEHPIGRMQPILKELASGQAVLLVSSFRPQPLIDKLGGEGWRVYSRRSPQGFETFLTSAE